MREGLNYLAMVESKDIKNYIFDSEYIFPKTVSSRKLLYFSVRIHMLKGGLIYYSRLCSFSKKCSIDKKDLFDS